MDQIIRQLKLVRETGKWLLLTQMLLRWGMGLVGVLLLLVLLDYMFVLPGWLRLGMGVVLGWVFVMGVGVRVKHLMRFNPGLEEVALKAEQGIGVVRGELANAVSLWMNRVGEKTEEMGRVFARGAARRVVRKMDGVSLMGLLDVGGARRAMWGMMFCVGVLVILMVSAPRWLETGVGRWVLPLSDVVWPQRVYVQDLTGEKVVARGGGVRFVAGVEKGFEDGLRVRVHYRVFDEVGKGVGDWEIGLMNLQGFARFDVAHEQVAVERGIGVGEGIVGPRYEKIVVLDGEKAGAGWIRYWMASGDDRTEVREMRLADRPGVVRGEVRVEMPGYAKGLVEDWEAVVIGEEGHDQDGKKEGMRKVLEHAEVELRLWGNKEMANQRIEDRYPGLVRGQVLRDHEDQGEEMDVLRWKMSEDVASMVRLLDVDGIEGEEDGVLNLKVRKDELPRVEMELLGERGEVKMLGSGELEVVIEGRDDVGMEGLWLMIDAPMRSGEKNDGNVGTREVLEVKRVAVRQAEAELRAVVRLSDYELDAGDRVEVFGVGQDVYEVGDERHEKVRTGRRVVRIVDEVELAEVLRADLGLVRQHAVRAERLERGLLGRENAVRTDEQAGVRKRVEKMGEMLDEVVKRIERNKVADDSLMKIVDQAKALVDEVEEQSKEIEEKLENGQMDRAAMEGMVAKLGEMIDVLSQGKDVSGLQMRLKQLEAIQSSIREDTRELLPRTIGRKTEDLDEQTKRELGEIAKRQAELSEQAGAMVQRMQQVAEQMRRSDDEAERAAGEVMMAAAAIAKRQGLSEKMEKAGEEVEQGQLSQAGQSQSDAMSVMGQMMGAMQDQKKVKAMMLKRRLKDLSDQLEGLVVDQEAALGHLRKADVLDGLEDEQVMLRRRTMSVGELAGKEKVTVEVVGVIDEAVRKQGEAILGIRALSRDMTERAEERAVALLSEALKRVREQERQQELEELIEERAALIERYRALASMQRTIRDKTGVLGQSNEKGRKLRVKWLAVAKEEGEVREKAAELGEEVKEHVVFVYEHGRVDDDADQVQQMFRRGVRREDELRGAIRLQERIVRSLEMMADVLEQQNEESQYAMNESGGNSGGGDGAGGEDAKMIPPIAELRLLRAMQLDVNEKTVEEDEVRDMAELSQRQMDIAQLGEQMLKKMNEKKNAADATKQVVEEVGS
ncbi:hypothetical protein KS4_00140 [Poriferisphaera corsica]|uniref:DUF4175 domain-containing protein n=1 Tax=Poriferisphaera corsica TaxID=2528020 RepID=A0A517YP36_9BACT|nr:hypothetical protein [Poriferisphaera corsica]QDU31986.1 hypothetical protein KS4_00140 [Poriferisphaera corsica]